METRVEKLIIDKIKQKPLKIDRMNLGFINKVYDVKLEDKELIVRINDNWDVFKGLKENIHVLKDIGLPVPKVLYFDLSKDTYDFAYTILEKLPGNDLRYEIENMSLEEMSDIAEKVVFYQKIVGNLPLGKGFGKCNIGEKGIYNSWTEFLTYELNRLKTNMDKVINSDLSDEIMNLLKEFKVYFDEIKPICFLDDISLKNIIIDKGKLQGLIDFDWICYGDPLYNIALVQTGIMLHLQHRCMHYVNELVRVWEVKDYEKAIIDFYSIIHAADFLGFQLKRNNKELIDKLCYIIKILLLKIQNKQLKF